jgi:NADP-dependent 3-hydroxy acid dehydrogenase YdfG
MLITEKTIALVTGASSGLGAGLAAALGKRGAKVALAARAKGQERADAVLSRNARGLRGGPRI